MRQWRRSLHVMLWHELRLRLNSRQHWASVKQKILLTRFCLLFWFCNLCVGYYYALYSLAYNALLMLIPLAIFL